MSFKIWGASIIALLSSASWACEPARLKFEGTPFAHRPFQIERGKVYFFRGRENESTLAYDSGRREWCFSSTRALSAPALRGCLERKIRNGKPVTVINRGKVAVLRDTKGKAIATLSVLKNLLTVNFVNARGKITGKRLVFKNVTEADSDVLEVRGWNCPNPRFLSCAGGELKTLADNETPEGEIRVPVADLAKRLGHYHVSCTGIHER